MRTGSPHAGRRSVLDLCLAFGIALALLLLNLFINMPEDMQGFFAGYSRLKVTGVLVNALFFWLVILLWASFHRWRVATRKKMELEDVLSSISPDALIVVTPERRIVMCNASVEKVFGYAEREVLDHTTDLLYFDLRSRMDRPREIYEALERDGFHIGTATGKRKDGSKVPLEVISAELAGRGGAVLLLRDITERLRMEEERRRLEAQAQRAQKLESLGVLAGGIAHDFNTCLMIIQGNTDLALRRAPAASPLRESLEEIEKASQRASELCRNLLSFSGKGVGELRPVALGEVVRETAQLLAVSIPKSVEVRCQIAPALSPIQGDVSQVQQIVMNLITNAADAIGPQVGTITIAAGVREVSAPYLSECAFTSSLATGPYVALEVTDTGCGMDEETKQKVFDPFFTTKPSGHGMGLAAVLGMVRNHNGAIRAESTPGKGACFTVLFPLPSKPV